jgi:uncharacterized SAM-binding protein YcdF (DUF218 family)
MPPPAKERGGSGQRGIAILPIAAIVLALLLLWGFRDPILGSFGTFLDNGSQPEKADAIVVLAGGWRGERILEAWNLKQKGYAPVVVVSSAAVIFGQKECLMGIDMLRRMGRPTDGFVCAESASTSTEEEAAALAGFVRRAGYRKILLVSCDTHMRRASRLWGKIAPDLKQTFVSAASMDFNLKRWHKTREGRKAVVLEWTKVVTSYFGI